MLYKTIKKLICLTIVMLIISGCSNSGNVTDPKKITFVNDLASRKKLYEEYPAEFSDSNYQDLADKMYLTFARRGTQEPDPIINVDDRGYIKPLGDGCYQFFEIEVDDGFKVGKNKIVNEEGLVLNECPYTEFIYYDDKGKPEQVKFDDLENDRQAYYTYYVDMLGNSKMKYEYFGNDTSSITEYFNEQGNSNIFHVNSTYNYSDGSVYEDNSVYEYKNGLLVTVIEEEYRTDYNHINSKIVETTGGFNTKYYNGFSIESSFWSEGKNIKVEEFYDNNGLVCMSDWYVNGEYDKTRFYVYDFNMGTMFTYDTTGYFLIQEICLYTSDIFTAEMYKRLGFKGKYSDFDPKNWYSLSNFYGS